MEMEKSVSLVKLSFSKKGLLKGTIIIVCLIALIAAIMIMPVAATTTTISPDKDAYIRDYSSYVNKNYGDTTPLWVYGRDGKNRRALIHFDLSSIPSGATIGSATLHLYNIYTPQEDRTLNVHRITDSWAEGSGNNELNSATINGTTWNERWFGANWGTAGGDYDSTVTGSNTSGTMADVWLEWDVKTDVQGFVSETYSNQGWLVKFEPEGSPTVCVKFPSREYTDDSTKRPKLVVEYTEAPCGCVGATQTFTCGETVTESCVFNCDMSCPTGHGLVVGGDDIVIDGAGYTIDGVSPGECVLDRAGIYGITLDIRDNVTIKNLKVKNFCSGIFLSGLLDGTKVTNVTIDNCTIYDNGVNATEKKTHGIKMIRVHDSTIENCKIYNNTGGTGCTPPCENGGSGIFLKIGNDNVITNNEIYDNKKGGFFCKASPKRCELSHNEVWGNHQGGLILRCKCTQNFTIEYNNVSYNYGTGIFIGGPCNTIRHNNVSNNMNGAIEGLPDTGTNGCGVNFGRDDVGNCGYPPCGSMGSRLNTLINNTICDNEYLDIWERAAVRGTNNGVENKCDEPDGWNDDGTSGCTYSCPIPMPDLTVEKTVEVDEENFTFTVSYTVTNTGEATAGESETCKLVDGSIEECQTCPALGPGESYSGTFDVESCPCGTTLNVTVCADYYDAVGESDEANNCEVNTVECSPCPKMPDLTIQDKHETWINDTHFNVSYKVCNIGEGDADASEATLYIDGTAVEHQDTPALDAGACTAEVTFGTEVECLCGETVNITVCADNGKVIEESDEANNCEVNMVECPPCPEMPDLVISEKHEEWINFDEKTYNVTYTVNNIGEGPAGASTTSIKIDGTEEATDSVPVLAAGASHTAELGPFTMSGNKDIISVCADKHNVVDESDEDNNCLENEWKYGVETATGTGTAYFDSDTGTMEGLTAVDEATLPEEGKPDLVFKHGFFSFNITGFTGKAVNVTITLPSDLPAGTQYWKYGPTPDNHTEHWYQLPMEIIDGNRIRITLVDNGLGDDILTGEDGEIVDRGGSGSPPGVPPVAVPEYNIFGLFSLVGILSVVLATTTIGRRKRR